MTTLIIDVRTPEEFAAGHNPGSVNIPLQTLPNELNKLDRSKTLLFCCRSSHRSGIAVDFLRSHGFTDVFNVGGNKMDPPFNETAVSK